MPFSNANQRARRKPVGLKWRSSSWMVTSVIGLGIAVDLLVYSTIIPVMPFHLERLGYSNVSALTGWLLFAYSAGLVISTVPIAMLSERYKARQMPLVFGLLVLVASQIMLMEAPNYPVMCIARILQGVGSSVVWVVGLALLYVILVNVLRSLFSESETALMLKRASLLAQLGFAMCGLSVGLVIGPPVGGSLYSRFGLRGPCIFGISATLLDLVGRLIIIERKEALVWGVDPAKLSNDSNQSTGSPQPIANAQLGEQNPKATSNDLEANENVKAEPKVHEESNTPSSLAIGQRGIPEKNISLLAVIAKLSKSSRALVSLFIIFVYGVVYSSQEPAIPLHLQRIWNLNSKTVGLVFIAAVVPTLFSSPITGFLADKRGAEWIITLCLLLSLPWWIIIVIERHLALFIASFAMESFFTSGVMSPLTAELAAVSRDLEGIGYAHVYGAFNLVYGIGTSVGPIVGGQMYDHIGRGWMALCLLATGLLVLSLGLAICFVGGDPLYRRFHRRLQHRT